MDTVTLAQNLVRKYLPRHKKTEATYEELAKKFFDLDKAERQTKVFKSLLPEHTKLQKFSEIAIEIPSTELVETIINEIKLSQLDELL